MLNEFLQNTALLTFLGALAGGICAFIGGIVGVKIQASIERKTNKQKILLEYYKDLGNLYNFVNDIFLRTAIDVQIVRERIAEYKRNIVLNGKFSYFIAKKWLKNEHKNFIDKMDYILEDQDSSKKIILGHLLDTISNEMDATMKKM